MPTIRATIYDDDDQPIEVQGYYTPPSADFFDNRFGNWLPGDCKALTDIERADGEDLSPELMSRARDALWEVTYAPEQDA